VLDQHLMIVALTANASEEDKARYLASGMDGFLAKPVDETALHFHVARAIERQLQRGINLAPMSEPGPRPPSTAELDAMFGVFTGPPPLAVAAVQNAGRRATDLRARLRAAFAADLAKRRAELEQALAAADLEACARLLHGLRGSAGYLGQVGLHELCGDLERAADTGDLAALRAGMPHLWQALDAFDTTVS
jgi:HPt (histidine-containing phosphotransfer) domain-containing protein